MLLQLRIMVAYKQVAAVRVTSAGPRMLRPAKSEMEKMGVRQADIASSQTG